ncbi:MAG: hypothetical protein Q7R89_03890 [bacterium]|nr:hypothetical protein [bacterium]
MGIEQPNIENNPIDMEMKKWEEEMTAAGVSPTEMAKHRERVRGEFEQISETQSWGKYSNDQLEGMQDFFGAMSDAIESGNADDNMKPWVEDYQKRFGEKTGEIAKKNVEQARAELQRRSGGK